MWHLLADCSGIQRRSGVSAVWIVRGVLVSQRAWMTGVRGSSLSVGMRPRLRHRGSMDHRTIHESDSCRTGMRWRKNSPSWFYSSDGTAP